MMSSKNFRKMSLTYYKLDPANYLTAASLAWDAALLQAKIELELISDQEILTMREKAKRGGFTFVGAKRYAKANNKQMGPDSYNPKIESSYITYVDANNLYGWAMVQSLPYKDIKFVPCPPTSVSSHPWCPTLGTINPPTLETCPETFRTISEETCSATLRTVNPATLQTVWSEMFLSTILQTADDAETGYL